MASLLLSSNMLIATLEANCDVTSTASQRNFYLPKQTSILTAEPSAATQQLYKLCYVYTIRIPLVHHVCIRSAPSRVDRPIGSQNTLSLDSCHSLHDLMKW